MAKEITVFSSFEESEEAKRQQSLVLTPLERIAKAVELIKLAYDWKPGACRDRKKIYITRYDE